ncbi:MAG TPA: magnesium transporter CorA family protein [Candidatus Paceibacterota bacterium]|nr:magnesium transporter CorA family protein [Candidatus Paceibacterota bacterium]
MIKYFQKTVTKRHPKELEAFKVGSWIYVENPNEAEKKILAENFGIKENIIEDALDPNEVPRLEEEDGNVCIYARVPLQKGEEVTTSTVLIVIGGNFFLTLCSEKIPFLKKFLNGSTDFNTTQKTRFFLQVFSEINRGYSDLIFKINRNVRGKSISLEKISNKDITQFVRYEITLNDFLSALFPMNAVLETLLVGKKISFYEQDRDLMEDLSLSAEQLIDACRANLKAIVNIREAYSTILTNSLNDTIRTLTVVTVVLTIPTLVASLFGMNVPVPFSENPYGFIFIIVISIAISAAILGWFFRKHWV